MIELNKQQVRIGDRIRYNSDDTDILEVIDFKIDEVDGVRVRYIGVPDDGDPFWLPETSLSLEDVLEGTYTYLGNFHKSVNAKDFYNRIK